MDRLTELRNAIADNTVPGGSAYGRAAAEVIALTLEAEPDAPDVPALVAETAAWLVVTKPSMTSMRTVAEIANEAARGPDPRSEVLSRMRGFIADSEAAIDTIADHAADIIKPGAKVLYHSYSGSLVRLLGRAAETTPDLTILLTESRPYRESRRIVTALQGSAAQFVAYSDASAALAVEECDLVVVGCDALFADGSFANKIGSLPLALACREYGKPYYVATEVSKLFPGDPGDVSMEQRPGAEMAADWELWASGRVTVRNQFFERVPADLVTAYLTDRGVLTPDQVGALSI
jgi:translation initiation factor 2B subunit (eIF-2B alpha/beta/delta family)